MTYFNEQVYIPGLHLSLGIFNRLWTLLEEQCKELDFSLATESVTSASSFCNGSADTLTRWSNLKLELEADLKYTEVISDLITYTTVAVEDIVSNTFYSSLKEELEATKRRIKDMVHL